MTEGLTEWEKLGWTFKKSRKQSRADIIMEIILIK